MAPRGGEGDHAAGVAHGRAKEGGAIMQVDALSREDVESGKAMKRAMGLLAAVAVAAAVGLATVDVPEADLTPHVLKTDGGGFVPATSAQAPAAPASGELDPLLLRTDQTADQHG
jgi:hypothetical protein